MLKTVRESAKDRAQALFLLLHVNFTNSDSDTFEIFNAKFLQF